MRGLDGNYINTQGDALTRMQVAFQSEQNRQQIRAQLEATDTLRKLREQVNETGKKDGSPGPLAVKDDQSGSEAFRREENPEGKRLGKEEHADGDGIFDGSENKTHHIDIRV